MTSLPALILPIAPANGGVKIQKPQYATENSAGFDLCASLPETEPVVLEPGARALIPTGYIVAIQPGYEGQIRPRSGLALKNGVTVLNAPGTIDSDYRGEVGVVLINHGNDPFTIRNGDRIAQMVISAFMQPQFQIVDDAASLGETGRGTGGFGSTGVS